MKFKFLWLIAAAVTHQAHAFDAEPDGFRGIKWGTEYQEVLGLIPDGVAQTQLENQSRQLGINIKDFPLASYSKPDDKMSFGDVALGRVSYHFYNNRFVGAHIGYFDSTWSPAGEAYTRMSSISQKPPQGYDAKVRVDRQLKKFFGDPTKEPNLLQRMGKNTLVVYTGAMTEITSQCTPPSNTQCTLSFMSTQEELGLKDAFNAYVSERLAQKKAAEAKMQADKRAKPDF